MNDLPRRLRPALRLAFTLAGLLGLAADPAHAADGKWTPEQVPQLGAARLKQLGLKLPAERLWDPRKGTGLLAGAIWVDGCSAAFVSETGLFVTNHHCLFSILQEHATPDRDVIANGFLAQTPDQELPGQTLRARVPLSFKDVTSVLLAAVPEGADDLTRARAMEAKGKALVAECEKPKARRCQLAAYDGGLFYQLVETLELSDIRLVYAPPRGIGELGGDVDNWTWPRHTGDFAIGRAYVAPDGTSATHDVKNVPYRARQFFPLAKQGVKPGDFVMVLGYPNKTYRSLVAEEMAERRDRFFPARMEQFGERMRDLEAGAAADPAGRIAIADDYKTLANRRKNAEGQLAAFARGRILEKQREAEERVVTWARSRPEHQPALAAREELNRLVREQLSTWDRDFLLDTLAVGTITPGAKGLQLPTWVSRAVSQRARPDLDRDPEYMDRNQARVLEKLEREQKNFVPAADRRLFVSFVRRALALPKGQRIAAVDALFAKVPPQQLAAHVDALYAKTKVFDLPQRRAMFAESLDALRARKDPLLELGFGLDAELEAHREREDRHGGAVSRLRPLWRRAVIAHAGQPVAPDANGTLRVSFAHVKGYRPRDGVTYEPQTTLSGALAKHTGEAPFNVPAKVREVAQAGRLGSWADPKLGDVPLCFLADADTTGGNSGSPTVNASGELVGVNFDRVWENVANDFGFNPEVARNINADVRYLLWMLDQVEGAHRLLGELGIRTAARGAPGSGAPAGGR